MGDSCYGIVNVRLLNRIVARNGQGVTVEADSRHQEIMLQAWGLQTECKGVMIPGIKRDNQVGIAISTQTMYRSLVARALCLSMGRSDIVYAVKELSRGMSNPDSEDWND